MSDLLEIRYCQDRGRALFTKQPVRGGQVVVRDAPVLLWPTPDLQGTVCHGCLRMLGSAPEKCPSCSVALYCHPACRATAAQQAGMHGPLTCRMMQLAGGLLLEPEVADALQFLMQLMGLQAAAASDGNAQNWWQAVGSLHPAVTVEPALVQQVAKVLSAVIAQLGPQAGFSPPSEEQISGLLSREAANSFGIMAPSGPQGERRVRGSGIYPQASLLNHDCLPNVARFDNFDSAAFGQTQLEFKALHDLPAGVEVTACYFPLTWNYEERRERCQEQYGFECTCPRCKMEAAWVAEEEAMVSSSEADVQFDLQPQSPLAAQESEGTIDEGYVSVFLLRHVCPDEDCLGTLAPDAQGSTTFVCNMCGQSRTYEAFLMELEQGTQHEGSE